MTDTTPPASTDALQKLFPWLAYMPSYAPQQLVQPINQGWTFGNVMVTTQNSSAPGIEHAIASKVSYGRQLGRLMDAMEVLVRMLPADARKADAITDFVTLAADVRKVKGEAQAQRLDRLKAELDALKREDPEGWKNLVKG
jgi:hypothetical protein